MKRSKFIVLVLLLSMFSTTTAIAAEAEPIESLPTIGQIGIEFVSVEGRSIKQASDELLAATSLDEIAKISRMNFEADVMATSETAIQEAMQLMDEYREVAGAVQTARASLSSKEFLAYICMADGLSAWNVVTANNNATDATDAAREAYPNSGGGLQDSYRHFVWNHMMTESLSKLKARVVGCNYEWINVLLPYAESAYDDYIDQGYTTSEAAAKAYQYAYYMREDCYSVCAAGVQYFSVIFDNAAIRDFWNNCYGRAYADNYTYDYSTAFTVSNNAGELINADSSVTSNHINNVWSWDWYTA